MMLLPNLLRSHQTLQNNASLITRRCMSSTTSRFNHPSSSKSTDAIADDCGGDSNSSFGGDMPQHQMHILDERTLLTQLSPLKRILCLCPVPLGRGRVSWSGGDALATTTSQQQQTINLDFQTQHSSKRSTSHNDRMRMLQQQQQQLSPPPPKVGKYRYGERFAIGVAVSDPYLTHAVPVPLNRRNRNDPNDDNGTTTPTYFTAEIVPTFKGDLHNLHTSSPIFHTNLPYFRKDFLQHIGHVDIGAIVLALPMESSSSRNAAAFCPMPTKLQLEEERQSEEVRECLFGLLQNYVSVNGEGSSFVDEEDNGDGGALDSNKSSSNNSRRDDGVPFFGPLNVQGRINHRLTVADVLSKASDNGNWDHLVRGIHSSQIGSSGSNNGGTYPSMPRGGRNFGGTTDEDINGGPAMTVSPEMHAAVALNAMLERHTSDFHNSFF
mmetsp:Transcript_6839/g.10072  ORF Transcript_6839/g.10072 Transcript_6839/m.10072 type:complete len:437 (+) Transcript_6839:145-1455(+)